jgi:uncharacterized protein (TIGR02217 family)
MSYIRKYISTCEGYGWTGGPVFNTRIVRMANGRERRNADQDQPQHVFSVPFNNIGQTQYAPIKQMHLNRRGQWGCFLFRDRLDDVADDEFFAVAETGQTVFQLAKWSIQDGVGYRNTVHAIYAPEPDGEAVASDVSITVNGVADTGFTVDYDSGVVTFDSGLTEGDVLNWSGAFSRWVRFARDDLPFSIDNRSGDEFVVNGSVDLIEMPPPPPSEVS